MPDANLGIIKQVKINKKKSGTSNVYQEIKQDFYRWVDSTGIKKEQAARLDLKSILFNFHEIKENESLEGKNWNQITLKNKFNGNAERGKETFLQIVSSNGQQAEGFQEQKPQQSPVETNKKPVNYLAFWIIGGLALAGVLVGIIYLMSTKQKRKIPKQT